MKTLQSVLLEICYHLHYLILKTILHLDQNLRISHLGPKVAIMKTGFSFGLSSASQIFTFGVHSFST